MTVCIGGICVIPHMSTTCTGRTFKVLGISVDEVCSESITFALPHNIRLVCIHVRTSMG
jgi:hypothetical protein